MKYSIYVSPSFKKSIKKKKKSIKTILCPLSRKTRIGLDLTFRLVCLPGHSLYLVYFVVAVSQNTNHSLID